jgi:hypothetical protein
VFDTWECRLLGFKQTVIGAILSALYSMKRVL